MHDHNVICLLVAEIGQGKYCSEDKVCVAGSTCHRGNDSLAGQQCTCTDGISKPNGDLCGKDSLPYRSGQVRSGQVRSGQYRSGQVSSGQFSMI